MSVSNVGSSGSTGSTGSANSSSTTNSADTLTEQDFLQLLTEEMKNQDPTDATDASTYVNQLADFSTINGQTSTNSDLSTIIGLLQQIAGTSSTNTNTNSNTSGTNSDTNGGTSA